MSCIQICYFPMESRSPMVAPARGNRPTPPWPQEAGAGALPALIPDREKEFQMKTPMFASILKYTEAPTFADELVKRQEEVMSVLRPIRGFHAYYLIKTNDGATSVTVCDDRTG